MFRGDVVAFLNPAAGAAAALLVRRVVALPGDEMVSDTGDDPFVCVAFARGGVAPLLGFLRSTR